MFKSFDKPAPQPDSQIMRLGIWLSLSTLLFVFIIADISWKGPLYRLDLKIQRFLETGTSPWLTKVMSLAGDLAQTPCLVAVIIAVLAFLLWKKAWWEVATFATVAGLGGLLLLPLKIWFNRPRPFPGITGDVGFSFPSWNAYLVGLIYGYVLFVALKFLKDRRSRIIICFISILIIVAVGMSRIYLKRHWLTDVLGAYALALAWLWLNVLAIRLIRLYQRD